MEEKEVVIIENSDNNLNRSGIVNNTSFNAVSNSDSIIHIEPIGEDSNVNEPVIHVEPVVEDSNVSEPVIHVDAIGEQSNINEPVINVEPIASEPINSNNDTANEKKENNLSIFSFASSNNNYVEEEVKVPLEVYVKTFLGSVALIILLILLVTFFRKLYTVNNDVKKEVYTEETKMSYQVLLNENEFYEEDYLGEGQIYISSLVKGIAIHPNYYFKSSSDNSDVNFQLTSTADLIVGTSDEKKVLFKKSYKLNEFSGEVLSDNTYSFNDAIYINFDEYNSLAKKFVRKYGLNSSSYLLVSLKIRKISGDNSKYNNESVGSLRIPLLQNSFQINKKDLSEKGVLSYSSSMDKVVNVKYAFFIIICLVLLVFDGLFVVKNGFLLLPKKSRYDRLIGRILTEFDRMIVDVSTLPNHDMFTVSKVENFKELVDVRDNLKEPIKYYVIKPHEESEFYITHNNELYILSVNTDNMETSLIKK